MLNYICRNAVDATAAFGGSILYVRRGSYGQSYNRDYRRQHRRILQQSVCRAETGRRLSDSGDSKRWRASNSYGNRAQTGRAGTGSDAQQAGRSECTQGHLLHGAASCYFGYIPFCNGLCGNRRRQFRCTLSDAQAL